MSAVEQLLGDELEAHSELVEQLVLPLVDEAAWRDHEHPLCITADDELLDVEAGHDRLARTGIVGEQEPQGLAGEHLAVDGLDLVRKRFDFAGGQRQVRVEEVGEVDAAGLGGETELVAVTVEAPRSPGCFSDSECAFVGAVEELLAGLIIRVPVGEGDRLVAMPHRGDHGHGPLGFDAVSYRSGDQVLQFRHACTVWIG